MLNLPSQLEPLRETILRTRRPIQRCVLTPAATQPWQSKIGGHPYLPAGFNYPADMHNKPMRLLAQINFAEMPPLEDFPASGILQFFIAADDDLYGLNFEDQTSQKGFRVLFHDTIEWDPLRIMTDFSFLNDSEESLTPVSGEYAIRFEPGEEYVSGDIVEFEPAMGKNYWSFFEQFGDESDEVAEAFQDLISSNSTKLGGYPFFTQADPRESENYARFDTVLFQSTSEENIMWGDVGVGNWFINREDLRRRDFSNILYNWDCG